MKILSLCKKKDQSNKLIGMISKKVMEWKRNIKYNKSKNKDKMSLKRNSLEKSKRERYKERREIWSK